MLKGPATLTYQRIKTELPDIKIIASGGISGMKDITVLSDAGIDGVITGKAIYEGKIKLSEIENYIIKQK
jgi:phosphoribosylformimino-5-aminoimidazole carboxamide ribotide isomerase